MCYIKVYRNIFSETSACAFESEIKTISSDLESVWRNTMNYVESLSMLIMASLIQ